MSSFDEEAVGLIQSTAIIASECQQAAAPEGVLVLHKHFTLENTERYELHRRRFRGIMKTHDINDYAKHVYKHAEKVGGAGFINGDDMSCLVFFNLGTPDTPGHGDWCARLDLQATAPYKAVQAIDGTYLGQLALTNWLEDWADNIVPYSGNVNDRGSYGSVGKAVDAIRKITIKAGSETESNVGDFAASRTAIEEIEAKSKVGLPAGFEFTCEPYMGLPSRMFVLRLQVLTGDDKPKLVLRVTKKEAHQESIVNDFHNRMSGEIGETVDLTIGTFTP